MLKNLWLRKLNERENNDIEEYESIPETEIVASPSRASTVEGSWPPWVEEAPKPTNLGARPKIFDMSLPAELKIPQLDGPNDSSDDDEDDDDDDDDLNDEDAGEDEGPEEEPLGSGDD